MTEATMERIYQELLPDAPIIKEYEARGIEIGALREARSLLRMALDARFPEVAAPAWIDSLTDLDVLHALARSVMRAAAATEVIAALESAAPRPQ